MLLSRPNINKYKTFTMLLMYKSCAKLLVLLLIFLTTTTASGGSNAYGNEPWLFFGDPIAPSSAIVHSALGSARFTILTPRLIRIEGPPPFEDARTLVVWNRNLSVPSYTTNTTGMTTTIDTGAFGVLLTYIDDGSGSFTSSNLQIQRRTPSFWSNVSDSWTPSLQPGVDDGQLFGTFHTLDDGLNGFVGLNCSLLDPNNDSEGAADFYPCDFGLLSKRGFFLFDDSNSPVWDETLGWLKTQDKAICAANESLTGTHCFAGSTQDTTDPLLCHAAGCCLAGGKNSETLSLWYSSQRDDHFSDNHNCTDGCGSYGYAYLHDQGTYSTFSDIGYVPLNLYWNQNPRDGAGGDNVASSFAPTEPGYTFARNMGYVYDPSLPQPKATVPLKVFYSATHLDHWTTASDADEQQAISLGYTMIGLAGYITPPSSGPAPPAPPFNCYRPTHHTDMYLFAHGIEYDSALSDYIAIAGAVPIPRRHWLGVSWSKWNESEIESDSLAHVRLLQQAGFPLDTLIFDMQWHRTPSWGGYSWDPSRYSDHVSMLQTLHSEGLQIGANFHDDDGVQQNDNPERWAAFAQAVGANINSSGVTFNIGNKTYADALQQIIMTPLISEGIDFVWTDFQQGMPGVADIRGLVPTAMINHYRFYNFSVAAGTRGTYHSRYAGRGDHRHSSHFGGDVDQTWESLRFMIYFTATAANAPACWWGHEMMRNGGGINDNSELFTRVNQFGAWSPIFTSWGNVGENNDWWLESEPFLSATRNSLLDRQRLLPYRYTVADVSHRTGRCPIVSMYRSYPTEPLAYSADGQYMLGTDLVVAPAFSPISSQTGTVAVTVWLPPDSLWVDFNSPSATPFLGGSSITYNASISIVPVFVRAGAVIPMLPRKLANVTGISARQYSSLEFNVFPSPETSATGHCEVYEDDGMSTDYLGGISARTTFEYGPSFSSVGCTEYTISTTGTYTNMITDGRLYSVFILSSSSPTSVSVNGINLSQSAVDDIPGTWYFSTEELHVFLPPSSTANAQSLIIC
jgi:alpha-glucosidase (family GH31 glycosyl hydrolase)